MKAVKKVDWMVEKKVGCLVCTMVELMVKKKVD